jgi:hypothetical protein
MRKRLMILVMVFAAAALSWVALGSGSAQASVTPTICNNNYFGGTFANVLVPSGGSCTLNQSHVKGTITVSPNSSLRTCGADIKGSVNATQAYVNMDWFTTVAGSVDLNESGTQMFGLVMCGGLEESSGYAAYICPRLIGGSLNVTNGDSSLEVEIGDCGPMQINGSVRIIDNDQYVSFSNANINGSLTCRNNWPSPSIWDVYVTGPVHGYCFNTVT